MIHIFFYICNIQRVVYHCLMLSRKENIEIKRLLDNLSEESTEEEMTEIKRAVFHTIHREGNRLAMKTGLHTSLARLYLIRLLKEQIDDVAEVTAAHALHLGISASSVGRAYGIDQANIKRRFKDIDEINRAVSEYTQHHRSVELTINGRKTTYDPAWLTGQYTEKPITPAEEYAKRDDSN